MEYGSGFFPADRPSSACMSRRRSHVYLLRRPPDIVEPVRPPRPVKRRHGPRKPAGGDSRPRPSARSRGPHAPRPVRRREARLAAGKVARVSFKVTATDAVDGPVPAVCAPKSGSRFRIGRTTVRCSAFCLFCDGASKCLAAPGIHEPPLRGHRRGDGAKRNGGHRLGCLGFVEPPTPARSVPQTCRRGAIKWERRSDVVGRSIRRRSAYPRTCVACRQTARIELEGAVLGALDRHPAPHPTMAVIVVGLATGASGAGRTRCVRRRARRSSPRAGVGRRAGRVRRGSAVARRAAGRGRSRVC